MQSSALNPAHKNTPGCNAADVRPERPGQETMPLAGAMAWSIKLLTALALLLVMSLPLVGPVYGLTWHNQQRVGQIAVFALATPVILLILPRLKSALTQLHGFRQAWPALILGLGLLSAARAQYPFWAMTEVALTVMTVALAWTVAVLRRQVYGPRLDRVLTAAVGFMCAAFCVRFLTAYLSLITAEDGLLNPNTLLDGFSNPRFFGQFQTLTMPLLAWPLLSHKRPFRHGGAFVALGVLWWTIVFIGGTRGTWLGLAAAMVAMPFAGRAGRRWTAWQAAMAAVGCLVFLGLMNWLPAWSGTAVEEHAVERVSLDLTGRDLMWSRALELIGQHPWLGVGPMHYNVQPPVAAHPHQAFLLWASEWGLPAGAMALGLLAWAAHATWRMLRRSKDHQCSADILRVCLAAAVLAAGMQAMVDGVTVMPYPQLWLAILSGWLLGLYPVRTPAIASGKLRRRAWGAVVAAAAGILTVVAIRDLPVLNVSIDAYLSASRPEWLRPRFWTQGFIDVRITDGRAGEGQRRPGTTTQDYRR